MFPAFMETQFAVHATLLLDFKEPKSTQQNSSDSSFQERNHLFPLECHVWQHRRSDFAQYISMISVDLLMCTVAEHVLWILPNQHAHTQSILQMTCYLCPRAQTGRRPAGVTVSMHMKYKFIFIIIIIILFFVIMVQDSVVSIVQIVSCPAEII